MSDTAFHHEEDYRGRLDLGLWRRVIRHARPDRRQLAGLGVSGIVIAGVDVLFPVTTAWIIDTATEAGINDDLLWAGGIYLALITILSACVWFFIVLAGQTATGIAFDLRRAGFARLQELSFSYFDVRPVGWLVSRLTSDCSKLSSLIPWFMLDLVWGTCTVVGITAAMFWLSWHLAIVVMVIVPPLALATVFFQRRLLESSRHIRRTNSLLTASFNECIAGVRTTKTLVQEGRNLEEFQELSSGMKRHTVRNSLQSAVYLPVVIALGSAGVGVSLWRGGVTIGGEGPAAVSLGTLVAFMQFAALLYMPIQELARRFTELQSAQAAAERIQELLDTEPEIRDDPALLRDTDSGDEDRIESIEFRDVTFRYVEDETVLESFDLRVRAGQTIALVGATGGGKSTIVSLAARFYEPTSGMILINGVDYRRRPLHWLQSKLGVVLQTPHLFSGTLRENVRYGRLAATDDEIVAAAKLVNAHGFITNLDDGYDTEVGEGGARLSTGQRQLIALARAVLADPEIFIMDEATSSVDTETESLIQNAIEKVLAGRIAFVVAHRLSTIRAADVILVIDGGRIVEQGDHATLMRKRGRYRDLYVRAASVVA